MSRLRFGASDARGPALVGVLGLLLAIGACGRGDDARSKSGASRAPGAPTVSEDVAAAERALEAAKHEVTARRQAAGAAQQAVAEAEKQAAAAKEAVREAQEKAALGSDASIFRAVQSRLLQDSALASVAISARVREGAVTLSGRVPQAGLRDRAVVIARETPGVRAVESEIEVVD